MLIGITGKAQSGKDLACEILQLIDDYSLTNSSLNEKACIEYVDFMLDCHIGMEFTLEKHSFADVLKDVTSIIIGCKRSDLDSQEFKKKRIEWIDNLTVREILQKLGTEVGRNIYQNIWVSRLFKDYSFSKDWIIPDVRFINEIEAVKEHGGKMIRIVRDSVEKMNHQSETELDGYDVETTIENNGTIEEFIKKLYKYYVEEMI